MVRCATCAVPIDIDESDDYTVKLDSSRRPRYTCYLCNELETESTSILTISEIDLSEG